MVMQNVELPELLGPAMLQVKGSLNLNHSYMTDVCHLPFLSLYISGLVSKQITERNRILIV